MTDTSNISAIINPVRILTVDERMKVAEISSGYEDDNDTSYQVALHFKKLLSRFEQLTRGKWVDISVCNGCKSEHCPPISSCCSGATCYLDNKFQPSLLKKEHFVCDVDRPMMGSTLEYEQSYQAAQDLLIFEGFEKSESFSDKSGAVTFSKSPEDRFYFSWFKDGNTTLWNGGIAAFRPTIYDLIYQIDLYNRTATTPIKINFTNQFIKKIIG